MYIEVIGEIKKIGEVKGDAEKTRLDIEVGDKKITVFTRGKEFDMKLGSEVVCKATEGEYNGKKQYSCSVDFIKLLKAPKVKIEEKKDKEVDWDGKERRMVRMNSLSHATALVNSAYMLAEVKEVNTMAEDTKRIAESLENWIYRS